MASVSCIYSLGDPIDYKNMVISLRKGMEKERDQLIKKLVELQYERNDLNFVRNKFRVRGDVVEIYPAYSADSAYRVEFFGDEIDRIAEINTVTGEVKNFISHLAIYPASHYIVPRERIMEAVQEIRRECDQRVEFFRQNGKLIEAQRIAERTGYDMEMLLEIGFCKGIENYSRVLAGREPGSTPCTLMDYFPEDFLMFIDESHVTLPQVRGMFGGDRSRKENLIQFGFRLPGGGAGHPPHRPAGPGDRGAAGGGADRRPAQRMQQPFRQGGAGAGDHPDQKDGGGPYHLYGEKGGPGAVHAPRRGHH